MAAPAPGRNIDPTIGAMRQQETRRRSDSGPGGNIIPVVAFGLHPRRSDEAGQREGRKADLPAIAVLLRSSPYSHRFVEWTPRRSEHLSAADKFHRSGKRST